MKIAVWHNLPSGGGKRALYDQVRGLISRGHVVEAWCPSTADQTYLPLGSLIPEHVIPLKKTSKNPTSPVSRMMALYRMTAGKMKALDQHCMRCAEAVNQGGYDLFFANGAMDYAVAPIGRYVTIPKVIYLQEPYRLLYEAAPIFPWVAPVLSKGFWHSPQKLKSLLFDFLAVQWLRIQAREELLNAQVYDEILVNSYYSRESVLRAYGLDASVCYLGIDTNKFRYQRQPRENFVLGVGAIIPAKNIRFILEALACLPPPRPGLVWVGNVAKPAYADELQRFAQSAGVQVDLRLRIGDDELVDLLNRAAAMVYAPRLEPFGFTPLEANACGTPVISVAEGGIRETVLDGYNGLLVKQDRNEMATAIKKLLDDPDLARKLGENGVDWVSERWSSEVAVTRLEQYLDRLVQASPHEPKHIGFEKNEYWSVWTD
jgi:glycosyltransferase involved in cell wall biosynthesis